MTEANQSNEPDLPNVGQPVPTKVKGVTRNAGQPLGASDVDEEAAPSNPLENYTLTPIEETEYVEPGLTELEVLVDGTYVSSTGEILKGGDRKLVSNTEVETFLGVKVNGSAAFKKA